MIRDFNQLNDIFLSLEREITTLKDAVSKLQLENAVAKGMERGFEEDISNINKRLDAFKKGRA